MSRDRTILSVKDAPRHEGRRQVSDELLGSYAMKFKVWGVTRQVESQIWRVRNLVHDSVENWDE